MATTDMTTHDTSQEIRRAIEDFSFKDFGKTLFHRFQNDNVTGLASQVAYNIVFAIPPLFILLVTIAAIVDNTTGIAVTETLHRSIANHNLGAARPLLDQLVTNAIGRASAGAVSIGAVVAFVLTVWGAAGGLGSLIDALNSAYEVKDGRKFVRKNALVLTLTVVLGLLVILALIIPLFAHTIGVWVASQLGLGSAFALAWRVGSWIFGFLSIALVLAILYYFAPDVEQDWKWISPGSLIAALVWLLAVFGFRIYLMFSNPASGYGAAGSVVVLLFFLWLSSLIFILGAEINAILEKRYDRKTIRDLLRHPGKTSPGTVRDERRRAREAGIPVSQSTSGQGRPSPIPAPLLATSESRKSGLIVLASLIGGVVVAALIGRKERSG